MNTNVITVVAGIPRSGTSLMMRMLYMGGMDVVANLGRASFEDERASHPPLLTESFLRECQGRAVKLLDPQRFDLPRGFDYRVILMDRDADEQAKSQVKFMAACGFDVVCNRETRQRLAASIRKDLDMAIQRLSVPGRVSLIRVRFESVVSAPELAAARVRAFCLPTSLDAEAMVGAVYPRSGRCLPEMLELALRDAVRTPPTDPELLAEKGSA